MLRSFLLQTEGSEQHHLYLLHRRRLHQRLMQPLRTEYPVLLRCAGLNDAGTGRERITKDNQNLNTNNIIEILLAAAAALLCAVIDYFTKENENDD